MGSNGIPYRNPSGCVDPTAHNALSVVQGEQDQTDERVARMIKALKIMIDQSGYDLLARIELRDRKTGRIYR